MKTAISVLASVLLFDLCQAWVGTDRFFTEWHSPESASSFSAFPEFCCEENYRCYSSFFGVFFELGKLGLLPKARGLGEK